MVILESGRILAGGSPDLLVDEPLMSAAGLAIPLVARPFQMLRPYLKERGPDLQKGAPQRAVGVSLAAFAPPGGDPGTPEAAGRRGLAPASAPSL